MSCLRTFRRGLATTIALLIAISPLTIQAIGPLGDPIEPASGLLFGDWPDRLEIDTPAGPGGFSPSVAIVASVTTRDGILGTGFRLEVGGAIIRRSATGGVPGLTDGELLLLDGTKLVPETTSMPSGGSLIIQDRYELETDRGVRATYLPVSNTWRVSRDGWTMTYGSAEGTGAGATQRLGHTGLTLNPPGSDPAPPALHPICSPLASPDYPRCDTAAWHLSQVTDPWGNWIEYDYTTKAVPAELDTVYPGQGGGDQLLTEIRWFDAKQHLLGRIELDYQERPDPRVDFSSGTIRFRGQRLTGIRSHSGSGALFSHYSLEYKDEGGPDCDGAIPNFDPSTSDARDLTGIGPLQTVVRRITRIDVDDPSRQRMLRCVETFHDELDELDWGEPELLTSITEPQGNFEPGSTTLIPIPANLNGDGRTDLILLGEEHQVLLSQTGGLQPFAPATSRDLGGGSYLTRLSSSITASHIDGDLGWAIADFDRDGYPDLISEITTGSVYLELYRPGLDWFGSSRLEVDACKLRFSSAADIDGDGFLDLVRRAHPERGECPARSRARWLRNLGHAPWFDEESEESGWRRLRLPLEDPEAAGLTVEPPQLSDDWTPAQWASDQARFADFNGDGITDVAYAFFARWEHRLGNEPCPSVLPNGVDEACQWRPVADSQYSRLFFGTGYGDFLDSLLSAGEPILNYRPSFPDDPEQWYTGAFEVHDLTRSGSGELISTTGRTAYPEVIMSHWRGVARGFGSPGYQAGRDTLSISLLSQSPLPIDDEPDTGSPCDDTALIPVISDFDGNGFPDLLSISYKPEREDGAPCYGSDWCVTLRPSERTVAQGRITAVDGPRGGRTNLEWGWTGTVGLSQWNNDLPFAAEVLTGVDGARGSVAMTYGRGAQVGGSPRGFGVVERRNARGGVEVFATATTPPLHGRPIYSARYRNVGGLEKLTVFVHGHLTEDGYGYRVDVEAPFFNPLIRRCDFEIERPRDGAQEPEIDELIATCWGWGERRTPSSEQLWAALGLDRFPPPGSAATTAAIVWGEEPADNAWLELTTTAPGLGTGLWTIASNGGFRQVDWYRQPGSELLLPPDPDLERALSHTPKEATGEGYRLYITDHHFETLDLPRATRIVRHRDTATKDDDLISELDWERPSSAPGWRMTGSTLLEASGRVLETVTRSEYAAFDAPGSEITCGENGRACLTTRTSWRSDGVPSRRETIETGQVQTWDQERWCTEEIFTDPGGRIRQRQWDDRCRLVREVWRSVERSYEHDGFNRIIGRATRPNGSPESVTRLRYDDVISEPDDPAFREPAVARSEGNMLELLHLDAFGRATRRTACHRERLTEREGDLDAACRPGSEVVQAWTLYDADGAIRALARPFRLGDEAPAFTAIPLRDGQGRALWIDRPASVDLNVSGPAWVTTRAWWAPGRRVERDPIGRIAVERATTTLRAFELSGTRLAQLRMDALGRLLTSEDTENARLDYTYDAGHRIASVTRVGTATVVGPDGTPGPAQFQRSFAYDSGGRLIQVIEADGSAAEVDYDLLDRPLERRHRSADGVRHVVSRWRYETPERGDLRIVTSDELGVETSLVIDGLDRPLRRSDAAGTTLTWAYEPALQQVRTTVEDGGLSLTTIYQGDVHGRVVAVLDPSGDRLAVERNGAGDPVNVRKPGGTVHRIRYAFSGLPIEVRLAGDGGSWLVSRWRYDESDRPVGIGADGSRRILEYDDLDRVTRMAVAGRPSPEAVRFSYDGTSSRPLRISRRAPGFPAADTNFAYDLWGRVTSRSNPEPGTFQVAYDVTGRVRQQIDEEGWELERSYDGRGRLSGVDLPGVGRLAIRYATLAEFEYRHQPGRRIQGVRRTLIRDAAGTVTTLWHDAAGRRVATRWHDGSGEERVFAGSRLADVYHLPSDGSSPRRLHYGYDEFGRLVGSFGPAPLEAFPFPFAPEDFDGYRIERRLGPGGRLEEVNAAGERTQWTFDTDSGLPLEERYHGLVRRFLYPDPRSGDKFPRVIGEDLVGDKGRIRRRQFRFDDAGRRTRERVNNGRHFTVLKWDSFDPWGQPTLEVRLAGRAGGKPTEQVAVAWTHDRNGRPVARDLRLDGTSVGSSRWRWLANGWLAGERGIGGRPLSYDWQNFRLEAVRTDDDGVQQARVLSRTPAGRIAELALPPGRVGFEWDPLGRMLERSHRGPAGTILARWSSRLDGFGRMIEEEVETDRDSWLNRYSYDDIGRLIREERGRDGSPRTFDYLINRAGMRLSTRLDGTTVTTVDYDPDLPTERVVQVNGADIQLDPWGGVLRDQHGIGYLRNPDGSVRVLGRRDGAGYRIHRDVDGLPVAITPRNGARRITSWRLDPALPPLAVTQGSWSQTYLLAEGMMVGRLASDGPSDLLTDPNQTVLMSSVGPEADLTAFGDGSPLGGNDWLMWAATETLPGFPEVRLARHRVYDPATGRFLRPDPVGHAGGLHRTLYANGDPVGQADPLGLWACAARPGQQPQLGIDAGSLSELKTYNVTPPSFGSGNVAYDIQQIEVAAGLDPKSFIDWSAVNLIDEVENPYTPMPCGLKCEPPGGGPGDMETTSSFPGGPPVLALQLFGRGDGEKREARRHRRWQRKLQRRLAERGIEQGDLDRMDLSELRTLAAEIAGCDGVCSERQADRMWRWTSWMLGDPEEPSRRGQPPPLPAPEAPDGPKPPPTVSPPVEPPGPPPGLIPDPPRVVITPRQTKIYAPDGRLLTVEIHLPQEPGAAPPTSSVPGSSGPQCHPSHTACFQGIADPDGSYREAARPSREEQYEELLARRRKQTLPFAIEGVTVEAEAGVGPYTIGGNSAQEGSGAFEPKIPKTPIQVNTSCNSKGVCDVAVELSNGPMSFEYNLSTGKTKVEVGPDVEAGPVAFKLSLQIEGELNFNNLYERLRYDVLPIYEKFYFEQRID